MLEDKIKVGSLKATDLYREVEPVSPYPRINPQQQRPEGYVRPVVERKPDKADQARRRFTAMRELIEKLKEFAPIVRVDFNTAHQEVCDKGLAIAEEELISQLLQLKVSLGSIDELVQQLQQKSSGLTPVSGRIITTSSKLFPVYVEGLSEYILRFDDLQVKIGEHQRGILEEINNNGRFVVEHNRLRLTFRHVSSIPTAVGAPLSLNISIQVGAIEVNETGRRAILYQRPNSSYALYSDKSINLSI